MGQEPAIWLTRQPANMGHCEERSDAAISARISWRQLLRNEANLIGHATVLFDTNTDYRRTRCTAFAGIVVLCKILEHVMHRQPAVYILTNKFNGTLYTGVTSDLLKRVWQHKNKVTKGFSAKYNLTKLVYFELYGDMYGAVTREKQLKAGSRKKKLTLIKSANPNWRDLYDEICG